MILVVGYGNPLCHDDGFGQEVALRLSDTLKAKSERYVGVSIITCNGLTPDLVSKIGSADSVIFINATQTNALAKISQSCVDHSPGAQPYTHTLTPAALLYGTRSMYQKCPEAYLYTVGGAAFDFGEGLSSEIEDVIPTLLSMIMEQIDCLLHKTTSKTTPNWMYKYGGSGLYH